MDKHSNQIAQEGCDRCECGCKYWENDRCIDCGEHVTTASFRTEIMHEITALTEEEIYLALKDKAENIGPVTDLADAYLQDVARLMYEAARA